MYLYFKENKTFTILEPDGFPNIDNWNLMCFYQYQQEILFVAYLNNQANFYQFNFHEENFRISKNIHEGIHAFKWKISNYEGDESKRQMIAIIRNGNGFFLDNIIFEIKKDEEFNYNEIGMRFLTQLKSNYLANFKNNNHQFYWINYNNVSDFEIGYYTNAQSDITSNNFYSLENITFQKSPFEFLENVIIEDIRFI